MERYKTITVSRRVKLMDFHRINDKLTDITYKMRKRVKPPKPKPALPNDANFGISENGYLFYRADGKIWVYPLSKQKQTLIKAILTAKDGVLDGDEAFKALDLKYWETQKMKGIVGNINRKLKENKIPVKISSADHKYRFVER